MLAETHQSQETMSCRYPPPSNRKRCAGGYDVATPLSLSCFPKLGLTLRSSTINGVSDGLTEHCLSVPVRAAWLTEGARTFILATYMQDGQRPLAEPWVSVATSMRYPEAVQRIGHCSRCKSPQSTQATALSRSGAVPSQWFRSQISSLCPEATESRLAGIRTPTGDLSGH